MGGASVKDWVTWCIKSSWSFNDLANCCKHFSGLSASNVLIGPMGSKLFLSWWSSRGLILPVATFDTKRSKSPIFFNDAMMDSSRVGSSNKAATRFKRAVIAFFSLRGNTTHFLSIRLPIGVTTWLSTSIKGIPSGWLGESNSKFLTEKRSSHMYRSSSSRVILEIWANSLCSVSSK